MARVEGFEPPTAWFVARYSIQLSYTRAKLLLAATSNLNNGGEGGIRTLDTRICVWFLSRELVSATHPPLLDCGVHFTDSLA